jgi:hypothetical protein
MVRFEWGDNYKSEKGTRMPDTDKQRVHMVSHLVGLPSGMIRPALDRAAARAGSHHLTGSRTHPLQNEDIVEKRHYISDHERIEGAEGVDMGEYTLGTRLLHLHL